MPKRTATQFDNYMASESKKLCVLDDPSKKLEPNDNLKYECPLSYCDRCAEAEAYRHAMAESPNFTSDEMNKYWKEFLLTKKFDFDVIKRLRKDGLWYKGTFANAIKKRNLSNTVFPVDCFIPKRTELLSNPKAISENGGQRARGGSLSLTVELANKFHICTNCNETFNCKIAMKIKWTDSDGTDLSSDDISCQCYSSNWCGVEAHNTLIKKADYGCRAFVCDHCFVNTKKFNKERWENEEYEENQLDDASTDNNNEETFGRDESDTEPFNNVRIKHESDDESEEF